MNERAQYQDEIIFPSRRYPVPKTRRKRRVTPEWQLVQESLRAKKSVKTEAGQSTRPRISSGADGTDVFGGFKSEVCESSDGTVLLWNSDSDGETRSLFEILGDPSLEPPTLDPGHRFADLRDDLVLYALHALQEASAQQTELVLQDVDDSTDSEDGDTVHVKKRQRFVCPFYARDKQRYRSCLQYADLRSILDVKRHVCKDHRLPFYCPICFEAFKEPADRDDHIREHHCSRRQRVDLEGVGDGQVALLARLPTHLSDTKQWFAVFNIVLPQTPLPRSAYLGDGRESLVTRLRAFWDREGERIVSEFVARHAPEVMEDYSCDPDEERSLRALHGAVVGDMIRVMMDNFSEITGTRDQDNPGWGGASLVEKWGNIGRDLLELLRVAFRNTGSLPSGG